MLGTGQGQTREVCSRTRKMASVTGGWRVSRSWGEDEVMVGLFGDWPSTGLKGPQL